MAPIHEKIVSFIKKHHVLTLSTSVDNQPWCANMFYAYSSKHNIFVFTSDGRTTHASNATQNPNIAASIVLETKVVGKIQGLQLCGRMERVEGEMESIVRNIYIKKFPFAAVATLNLWVILPEYLKFTDNTLGFGKKLIWNKNDDE